MIARALPRPLAFGMNRTEAQYADELEARRLGGALRDWRFQALTLKLADDTRYTPDFLVIATDGTLECHEVKGFWRDDAKVKIKVAARLFPFRFVAVQKVKGYFERTDFTEAA